MTYANYDNIIFLSQMLIWSIRLDSVSMFLKLFGSTKTVLWDEEVGEFSVIWENGLVGIFLPANTAASI